MQNIRSFIIRSRSVTFQSIIYYILSVLCILNWAVASEISEQQARAEKLYKIIRCMPCVTEPIAESRSDFANEMRAFILKEIKQGKTDHEIITSLKKSYGDDIIMETHFTPKTFLLWLLPMLILAIGIYFIV
jgi:cytochrome c-type biogenesis protein CcmH